MRIGFDFDNTIVNYDLLFYKVACEKQLIDKVLPQNKIAVRNYLRSMNNEDAWTEMQGDVYGARMQEAISYPDAIDVMRRLKEAGHTLAIISHKTKYPYLGKQHDLHAAAREWISRQLIQCDHIFFELTKEEKINRIREFDCDIFIDDLPEILLADGFPRKTKKILFDPEIHHAGSTLSDITLISSWTDFERHIGEE